MLGDGSSLDDPSQLCLLDQDQSFLDVFLAPLHPAPAPAPAAVVLLVRRGGPPGASLVAPAGSLVVGRPGGGPGTGGRSRGYGFVSGPGRSLARRGHGRGLVAQQVVRAVVNHLAGRGCCTLILPPIRLDTQFMNDYGNKDPANGIRVR